MTHLKENKDRWPSFIGNLSKDRGDFCNERLSMALRPFKWPLKWMVNLHKLDISKNKISKEFIRTIFLLRFTPFIRAPGYFATGILGYSKLKFLFIDGTASC